MLNISLPEMVQACLEFLARTHSGELEGALHCMDSTVHNPPSGKKVGSIGTNNHHTPDYVHEM